MTDRPTAPYPAPHPTIAPADSAPCPITLHTQASVSWVANLAAATGT